MLSILSLKRRKESKREEVEEERVGEMEEEKGEERELGRWRKRKRVWKDAGLLSLFLYLDSFRLDSFSLSLVELSRGLDLKCTRVATGCPLPPSQCYATPTTAAHLCQGSSEHKPAK